MCNGVPPKELQELQCLLFGWGWCHHWRWDLRDTVWPATGILHVAKMACLGDHCWSPPLKQVGCHLWYLFLLELKGMIYWFLAILWMLLQNVALSSWDTRNILEYVLNIFLKLGVYQSSLPLLTALVCLCSQCWELLQGTIKRPHTNL